MPGDSFDTALKESKVFVVVVVIFAVYTRRGFIMAQAQSDRDASRLTMSMWRLLALVWVPLLLFTAATVVISTE